MLAANSKPIAAGELVELDPDDAEKLIAAKSVELYVPPKGAIKPTPEIFADPIVDPVVAGDQVQLPVLDPKLTVAQLTAIAVDEGVTIGEGLTKAEIIAAIALKREADNAGPREEGLE